MHNSFKVLSYIQGNKARRFPFCAPLNGEYSPNPTRGDSPQLRRRAELRAEEAAPLPGAVSQVSRGGTRRSLGCEEGAAVKKRLSYSLCGQSSCGFWERSVPIVHVTKKVSEMLSLIHWANSEVQSPAPMDPPYILFLFFKPSWHAFRTVTLSQAALTTSLWIRSGNGFPFPPPLGFWVAWPLGI